MPRCIICDYSTDIPSEGPKREVNYNAQEKGFVCAHCEDAIDTAIFEFDDDEAEDGTSLDGPDLLEWGELPLLEEEDGRDHAIRRRKDRT